MIDRLTLTRPDDWHVHLRDGDALTFTVPATAAQMGRAIVMPNLQPPVTTAEHALAYHQRILANIPANRHFEPLMVVYLTDHTTPDTIAQAKASGVVKAAKLYPAGATTNSDSGVTDLNALDPVCNALAEHGMPLLVHGEVTHQDIDIFDREKRFLDDVLAPLVERHPTLNVVVEHITTRDAAQFVQSHTERVGATITVQHLAFNRNHMLVGGIKPHYYCLPILKRNIHQQALQDVVASGDSRFFLGTDSAPHSQGAKESACGCAGCYTAYAAIELYADIFDDLGALDKLENFASLYGPAFYGLPVNPDSITLVRESWTVPDTLPYIDSGIVPLRTGETVRWRLQENAA